MQLTNSLLPIILAAIVVSAHPLGPVEGSPMPMTPGPSHGAALPKFPLEAPMPPSNAPSAPPGTPVSRRRLNGPAAALPVPVEAPSKPEGAPSAPSAPSPPPEAPSAPSAPSPPVSRRHLNGLAAALPVPVEAPSKPEGAPSAPSAPSGAPMTPRGMLPVQPPVSPPVGVAAPSTPGSAKDQGVTAAKKPKKTHEDHKQKQDRPKDHSPIHFPHMPVNTPRSEHQRFKGTDVEHKVADTGKKMANKMEKVVQ